MKFQIRLRGENLRMQFEGAAGRYGFYTPRFVEADRPEEAEALAIALVSQDLALRQALLNDQSDPPMICLDELTQVGSFRGVAVPGSGYTFFPTEDEA
jgi:hypothetical protein